ncbi:MAG: hypothetical protein Q9162_005460 [Coniocarpon cinnabarinum]
MFANENASGHRHGPPGLRRISSILTQRLSAWQTIVLVGLVHYILRNLGKLVGLECPEPLADLYEPAYFRATWATTALDAGFWTAMPIRRKWLAHICSLLFTGYYLINAEQADEKVRLVRSVVTVEHLRNSWNKTLINPVLKFTTWLLRPRSMRYAPREMRIPRPQDSQYKDPVHAWLYFDGPISALKVQTKLILNVPGGGFVAMSPRTHDDSLMSWAARNGIPILSLDYRKAPEYPYPYALHECFDTYRQIMISRGRCAGLFTGRVPQVIISGDSAGGNFAAGLTLMITKSNNPTRHAPPTPAALNGYSDELPAPVGLVLIYPCLDVNIGNWMTDEQMKLIRDKSSRTTNQRVLRRKNSVFMRTANTPYASDASLSPSPTSSDDEDDIPQPHLNLLRATSNLENDGSFPTLEPRRPSRKFHTPIAVPSMLSYFSDRVLTPEMMRAMIILYIGNQHRRKPDFAQDYYLSPVLAPDDLLASFPRTYFLTGERDPLVDDTCIMAGRLRRAKSNDGNDGEVKVQLIPGVSHGFMQMAALYPKAYEFIHLVADWYDELFKLSSTPVRSSLQNYLHDRISPPLNQEFLERHEAALSRSSESPDSVATVVNTAPEGGRHHHRTSTATTATSEESDQPLELAVKPLTSSLHVNGSARRPTPSRLKSLQTRRAEKTRSSRQSKDFEEGTHQFDGAEEEKHVKKESVRGENGHHREREYAHEPEKGHLNGHQHEYSVKHQNGHEHIEAHEQTEEIDHDTDVDEVSSPFARYHPIRKKWECLGFAKEESS